MVELCYLDVESRATEATYVLGDLLTFIQQIICCFRLVEVTPSKKLFVFCRWAHHRGNIVDSFTWTSRVKWNQCDCLGCLRTCRSASVSLLLIIISDVLLLFFFLPESANNGHSLYVVHKMSARVYIYNSRVTSCSIPVYNA